MVLLCGLAPSSAQNATEQVRFVDKVPSLHAIPTLNTGTPCGTEAHGAASCE